MSDGAEPAHSAVSLSSSAAATFRGRKHAVLSESRMREICKSGSMRGCGNGVRARLLRHRQTKGAATDKPNLLLPRHIPTLPNSTNRLILISEWPARLSAL